MKKGQKTPSGSSFSLLVNLEEKRWNCCNFYCISGIKNCIFVSMCSFVAVSSLTLRAHFQQFHLRLQKRGEKVIPSSTDTKGSNQIGKKVDSTCSLQPKFVQHHLVPFKNNLFSTIEMACQNTEN